MHAKKYFSIEFRGGKYRCQIHKMIYIIWLEGPLRHRDGHVYGG